MVWCCQNKGWEESSLEKWAGALGHRGSWPPQNEAGLYAACSGKAGKGFEPGMNMVKGAF